tara:strand:- start:215 stop:550 length:336 start_codon:yes stop_codon:yes gene_type:complete
MAKEELSESGASAAVEGVGYINNTAAEVISQECYKLLDEGTNHLVLNMGKTRMINSVGIAIIIEVIEKVIEKGGSFGFCCLSPTVEKTLKIMGLFKIASAYATEEDALSQA